MTRIFLIGLVQALQFECRGVKLDKYGGYLDNYHLAQHKNTLRSDVLVYGV